MSQRTLLLAILLALLTSCSGGRTAALQGGELGTQDTPDLQSVNAWPQALPRDGVQPWEGPAGDTSASLKASAINADSEFVPGIERFLEGAGDGASVSDQGEATRLDSGPASAMSIAWSIYRLPLGAEQPGALSLDVNYLSHAESSKESSYFVGLSDYGQQRWVWQGPFTRNNNVRLAGSLLPASDYSSDSGNMFVCVLAYDGSSVDVVSVAHNIDNPADTSAPPEPTGLSLTPVAGGVEAQWNDVLAGDLAGYQVYYSMYPFSDVNAAGVKRLPSLEGLTRTFIPRAGEGNGLHVAVAAVDVNGNQSTEISLAEVLVSSAISGGLSLTVARSSVMRGESLNLDLSGADSYDLDLDGDGVYEFTDSTDSSVSLDTSAPGLLRANVRGESGTAVMHGGVSVLIFANTRPVCVANAVPSSGAAPLNSTLSGMAEDEEDAAGVLSFAWDFNGDGMYDAGTDTLTPPQHEYALPGFYNTRLRVTDSEGAWSTDTVGILVTGTGPNELPDGFMGTDVAGGVVPVTVHFTSDNISDPDGTIVQYDWDFNGDGIWEVYDGPDELDWTFTQPGSPDIFLRVTDNDGGRSIILDNLSFTAPGNNPPVANLLPVSQSGSVPLVVNFDASGSTAGGDSGDSIVKYEWDFDGNGNWDGYGEDATISHTYTGLGVFTARLRVTDEKGNQHIDTSSITCAAANVPPQAVLTSAQPSCNPGESISFNASASSDADGSIALYEWDLDGNGSFETSTGTQPSAQQNYASPGAPTIAVRVSDDDGATDTAQLGIVVHGWSFVVVDSNGSVGTYCSLAEINGRPGISYYSADASALMYASSASASGSSASDWTSFIVDNSGATGQFTSLAMVNGTPAISYWDGGNADLRYARSTTLNGAQAADWSQLANVDSSGPLVGLYTSLTVVAGNPAISYYDSTNKDLRYARSTTASGALTADWSQKVNVDPTGERGEYSSLAVINGNPAIAYYDGLGSNLYYARSTTLTGSLAADWVIAQIDGSISAVGQYPSLGLVAGKPAISYYSSSGPSLRYAWCSTSTGASSADWTSFSLDSSVIAGQFSSMELIDGRPAIAYYDDTNDDLRFIHSNTASGSILAEWGSSQTLDAGGQVGQHSSLESIGGRPAISYYSASGTELLYAIMF